MSSKVLWGVVGGAAGTTVLDLVTYTDMTVRGRPGSQTPEKTVEALANAAGVTLRGQGDERENRLSGLGALSGILTGVSLGGAYGLVRAIGIRPPWWLGGVMIGTAAMAVSDVAATATDVTDPAKWSAIDWASDAVPHLLYGLTTAYVMSAAERA